MSPALGLADAAVVLVGLTAALLPPATEGPAIAVPADCTAEPMSDPAPIVCAELR
jgi:hypothetical protein